MATSITPPIANARALNRSASQPETGPAVQNPMGSQPPPRHYFFAVLPTPGVLAAHRYTGSMSIPRAFAAMGDERFISLTTFRKTGDAVSTPVWIARDGDDLVVTTPATSGKVKRLRNSGRVEMRVCDRMGRVKESAPVIYGTAEIEFGDDVAAKLNTIFGAKFRIEYRIFMAIERLGKQGRKDRVLLRISPA